MDQPVGTHTGVVSCDLVYAHAREKSIHRFKDQVRQRTKRKVPLTTKELIEELNPLLRGWGEYYKRAHVRRLFHRLEGWIVRRIWSHRFKRWRNVRRSNCTYGFPVCSFHEDSSIPRCERRN